MSQDPHPTDPVPLSSLVYALAPATAELDVELGGVWKTIRLRLGTTDASVMLGEIRSGSWTPEREKHMGAAYHPLLPQYPGPWAAALDLVGEWIGAGRPAFGSLTLKSRLGGPTSREQLRLRLAQELAGRCACAIAPPEELSTERRDAKVRRRAPGKR